MSKTKIEWADQVWNPVTGCTPISEGCKNCYAARMARRLAGRNGYPRYQPFEPTMHPDRLSEPSSWKKPQRIFVCSMGDLFHDYVLNENDFLIKIFAQMLLNKHHTFMLLTKRPANALRFMKRHYKSLPQHIWLGMTAENQRAADERIPILLQIPAAKHFVSVEPMLGPMKLTHIKIDPQEYRDSLTGARYWHGYHTHTLGKLEWVIAGPETGPGARPCNIDWVRDLQRQCAAAGVPFFDKKDALGETIQEWPR